MQVHKQKINAFKICDLITDPKSLDSLLLPHHHNSDIGFIVYKGKYADSLCQIRQQILKFSPRNLMICLKRDQITCFEGMLFHSKMTYIRMTRQYSKKKEEGAVTAITLVILGHRKTEGLYLVCTKIIL